MRTVHVAFRIAAALVVSAFLPFHATAADRRPEARRAPERGICEKSCHDDHRRWVDLCIGNHDPREITPSARGQCVAAGAERLAQCLQRCR